MRATSLSMAPDPVAAAPGRSKSKGGASAHSSCSDAPGWGPRLAGQDKTRLARQGCCHWGPRLARQGCCDRPRGSSSVGSAAQASIGGSAAQASIGGSAAQAIIGGSAAQASIGSDEAQVRTGDAGL